MIYCGFQNYFQVYFLKNLSSFDLSFILKYKFFILKNQFFRNDSIQGAEFQFETISSSFTIPCTVITTEPIPPKVLFELSVQSSLIRTVFFKSTSYNREKSSDFWKMDFVSETLCGEINFKSLIRSSIIK